MQKIGIVYPAPKLWRLLPTQTEEEKATQGLFVGLIFSPITSGSNLIITGLKVHQVFYKPGHIINSSLMLRSDYYSIDKTAELTSDTQIKEISNSQNADEYLNKAELVSTDQGLEFSDLLLPEASIISGQSGLPEFEFSFFSKNQLLGNLAGSTHIVITGCKITPGVNAVVLDQGESAFPEFFNLSIQAIRDGKSDVAASYEKGRLTALNTVSFGKPCPPHWGDG